MGPEPGVPRKPSVTDLPAAMLLVHPDEVAVTIAPDWLRDAPHDVPTVCPLRNNDRSRQRSVFPCWHGRHPLGAGAARNEVTQDNGEFQLMVSSLVDHDSMSSM